MYGSVWGPGYHHLGCSTSTQVTQERWQVKGNTWNPNAYGSFLVVTRVRYPGLLVKLVSCINNIIRYKYMLESGIEMRQIFFFWKKTWSTGKSCIKLRNQNIELFNLLKCLIFVYFCHIKTERKTFLHSPLLPPLQVAYLHPAICPWGI